MRYFILLFFMYFFVLNSFSFETVGIINPNYEIQNQKNDFPISNEELSSLEMKIFNKTFSNDMAINRLKRLEKEVMGMEQLGDIEERFELLSKVSEYYKKDSTSKISNNNEYNYYDKNSNKYYNDDDSSKNKKTRLQSFFDDIKDTFTYGTMTGYTPPMNYYNTLGSRYYLTYPNPYINRYDRLQSQNRFYSHPPPPQIPMNYNNPYNYRQPTVKNFNAGMGIRMIE